MTDRVFLTDFGLAKRSHTDSRFTRTGEILGTPAYMSPEQVRGDLAALAPATDVWALGCVLYEMLARVPAFAGDGPAAVLGHVMVGPLPTLAAVDVPPDASELLARCLVRVHGDRLADAREVRAACAVVLRGERLRAGPVRGPWLRFAVVAVPVVLVLLIAWPGLRKDAEPMARSSERPAGVVRANAMVASALMHRRADPDRAITLLTDALDLVPGRQDWRVELGLLLWAVGRSEAALTQWYAVSPDDPHARLARRYIALEAYFDAVRDHRRHVEAVRRLGQLRAAGGDDARLARAGLAVLTKTFDQARRELDGLTGWEATLLRAYVETAAPDGDQQAAIRLYDRALAAGIPFVWAVANRATARAKTGDLAGAIVDYSVALQRVPDSAQLLANRALAYSTGGQDRRAIADLDAALELQPRSVRYWVERGRLRRRQGERAAAAADLDHAVALDPEDAVARNARGLLRRESGDLAAALADLDVAVRVAPSFTEARVTRAAIYVALGRLQRARAEYDVAVRQRPGWDHARLGRADVRRQLGELVGAAADFEAILASEPDHPRALGGRGLVQLQRGDLAGALAALDAAITADPGFTDAYANRGIARRRAGDLAGAREDFDTCVRLVPGDPDSWGNRGALRRETGDLAGAVTDLQRARELDPNHMSSRVNLGLAHWGLGQLRRARAELQAAVRLAAQDPRAAQIRGWLNTVEQQLSERGR